MQHNKKYIGHYNNTLVKYRYYTVDFVYPFIVEYCSTDHQIVPFLWYIIMRLVDLQYYHCTVSFLQEPTTPEIAVAVSMGEGEGSPRRRGGRGRRSVHGRRAVQGAHREDKEAVNGCSDSTLHRRTSEGRGLGCDGGNIEEVKQEESPSQVMRQFSQSLFAARIASGRMGGGGGGGGEGGGGGGRGGGAVCEQRDAKPSSRSGGNSTGPMLSDTPHVESTLRLQRRDSDDHFDSLEQVGEMESIMGHKEDSTESTSQLEADSPPLLDVRVWGANPTARPGLFPAASSGTQLSCFDELEGALGMEDEFSGAPNSEDTAFDSLCQRSCVSVNSDPTLQLCGESDQWDGEGCNSFGDLADCAVSSDETEVLTDESISGVSEHISDFEDLSDFDSFPDLGPDDPALCASHAHSEAALPTPMEARGWAYPGARYPRDSNYTESCTSDDEWDNLSLQSTSADRPSPAQLSHGCTKDGSPNAGSRGHLPESGGCAENATEQMLVGCISAEEIEGASISMLLSDTDTGTSSRVVRHSLADPTDRPVTGSGEPSAMSGCHVPDLDESLTLAQAEDDLNWD